MIELHQLEKLFTPIGRKILIRINRVDQSKGGVVIPDTAPLDSTESITALVLAVGPDCEQVKRGDIIVGHPGAGVSNVVLRGVDKKQGRICLTDEEHILGIISGALAELY